ncbi:Uma2 family endonuclease [Geobacillus sp. CAMR5420]|uniref:Uma2 family endonuclease n=1 Tax=Geobacillus TaxID=129337 RepID=UPI00049F0243|nr:Uma2 family endonuclease [Geobacillus sp. CAMR5420]KDE48021.1 hypothetical protein DI44_10660 [Geobacillus sp. CAMR5420]
MQEAINMSPSPSWEHQIVCDNLVSMIKGKSPCQPISNLSVKLEKNGNVMNEFIQPDVAVYCERPEKIIGGYKGRPLIVIEVVSPSTYKIDVTLKKDLYCAYGVEEYWIVDPYNKTIRQCTLEHDRYAEMIIACGETFDSVIGTIDTALVFQGV